VHHRGKGTTGNTPHMRGITQQGRVVDEFRHIR
jgi:hypothetical protein